MATFRIGQKTHQAVLPHPTRRPPPPSTDASGAVLSALESESVDTPRIGHETGLRHHPRVVSGADHVRGETTDIPPDVGGVTTQPLAGERPRERHPSVFVLDKHHTPLQPCHPARARKLMAKDRAVVARHTPFTIRLKDRTIAESEVDGVQVGIDPGSKHTGIAVFTHQGGERRGRYGIQLDHRGARIRKKMGQRSAYRRGRRSRNLRHRAPRFSNRTRTQGWLPPSLKHRVETTVGWVDRLTRWAPVKAVHVERVAFDTHTLSAGRPLEGVEHQRGTLHGYEIREYLLAKFGHTCVYCRAMNTPLNLDHVHPRSRGGSDRVSNLVLACVPCNQTKADRPVEEFITDKPALARILARAKAPLRDAAAVQSTRWALWRALEQRLPTHVGSGGRTKWNRTRNHLPKTHTLDALAVGKVDTITQTTNQVLVTGCAGRGSYARTRPDRYGFPRLRLPRTKGFFGFTTGDLVRVVVPKGKKTGTYTGRVAVRASGSFDITTAQGTIQGIRYKHMRLLQRADGYGYTLKGEGVSSRP